MEYSDSLSEWISSCLLVHHDQERGVFIFWNGNSRFFVVCQEPAHSQNYGRLRGFYDSECWDTAKPPADRQEAIRQASAWWLEACCEADWG